LATLVLSSIAYVHTLKSLAVKSFLHGRMEIMVHRPVSNISLDNGSKQFSLPCGPLILAFACELSPSLYMNQIHSSRVSLSPTSLTTHKILILAIKKKDYIFHQEALEVYLNKLITCRGWMDRNGKV
jgi:hypothetical protein